MVDLPFPDFATTLADQSQPAIRVDPKYFDLDAELASLGALR